MDGPLVSIALCTFNGAVYLKEQLDSLVNQSYTNLEILVVDDRSSDDTVSILQRYAIDYPRIRIYLNDRNLGYVKNFEKAIGLCKGDYIALCDQDDVWDNEKISIMMNKIASNLLAYHDSMFIDEAGISLNKKVSDIRNCYSGTDSRVFLIENCVSGHALLFKRDLLNYIDGFKALIMHDWWLAYAASNIGSVLFVDKVLVNYRQHSNANTNILRQERAAVVKQNSLQKIERQFQLTALFASYPYNKDQKFKTKLLALMENRMKSYFSFSLAFFVLKHYRVLLHIQKKTFFSKMNFIWKLGWGYKLKQVNLK